MSEPGRSRRAPDRRVRRTRQALIEAFTRLVLSRRYEDIRVADIAAEADVGRSTFYDHYPGRDAIHLEALRRPLGLLADCVTGEGDRVVLTRLLGHFWDNRALARSTFSGPQRPQVVRTLAELIGERLGGAEDQACRILAIQLAEGQVGLIRAWVSGEVSARPETIAEAISQASAEACARLRDPSPGLS